MRYSPSAPRYWAPAFPPSTAPLCVLLPWTHHMLPHLCTFVHAVSSSRYSFPKLPRLANSYPSYKTQSKWHLLPGALPVSPSPTGGSLGLLNLFLLLFFKRWFSPAWWGCGEISTITHHWRDDWSKLLTAQVHNQSVLQISNAHTL